MTTQNQYVKIEKVSLTEEISTAMKENDLGSLDEICIVVDGETKLINRKKLTQRGLVCILEIWGRMRNMVFEEAMSFQNLETLEIYIDAITYNNIISNIE